MSEADVSALYTSDYKLPAVAGQAEDKRGEAYADVVTSVITRRADATRVLDVGCGSGSMLKSLVRRPLGLEAVGVDPARVNKIDRIGSTLTLYSGDTNIALGDVDPFDVVVSINTIEHTADPVAFLRDLGRRTYRDGQILVICPAAQPANCELLFYDHLWTLTPEAFAAIAAKADLPIWEHLLLATPLSGFQLFVLGHEHRDFVVTTTDTASTAMAYLEAWSALDAFLEGALDRVGDKVQMFGAGQMAALLRAYAPRAFGRVKRLVLDRPEEAWPLGEARAYDPADHRDGWVTILGVHPSSQRIIAERICRDGGVAIPLPPEIQC